MIIVNFIGGLGNQMFQYAFGYAVSKKTNQKLKLDIRDFDSYKLRNYELGCFDIVDNIASIEETIKLKYQKENIFIATARKLAGKGILLSNKCYRESNFSFDDNVFNIKDDTYFSGYWQNEKYFKDYRSEILKKFALKKDLHIKTNPYKQQILNTTSISLHIRRGDYITNPKTNSYHGVCSMEYYLKSINHFRTKEPYFFIFSDDLNWAKDNFDFINNKTFVELDENTPDHEEMYLMSLCRHNIIANSSFSWWGAWLNQNKDKEVIAPQKWFVDTPIDIIPNSWTVL